MRQVICICDAAAAGDIIGIPIWHSLILACFFGPVGFLAHLITKAFCKPKPQTITITQEGGSITIMPYDLN
jgi:hypothetical protein